MTELERFLQAAREAGCPADQVRNFRRGGYLPQPKQLLFHAAAREADRPGGPTQIGFGGARGPGKSHAVFGQLALDDCQRQAGLKTLYLRKIGRRAREQLNDLRVKVLRYVPHAWEKQGGVIRFGNGSRVMVGHFRSEGDIDNYLGIEYDAMAIEEATSLTRTKYQALRDSNRTSKDGWRPRIYTSTNPGGVGHAWFRRTFIDPYQAGEESDTRFVPGTVEDNVFIDPDYRRKLEENTGWRLRAYRYGDWDIIAGQFFTTFWPEVHVINPFAIPNGWRLWLAMDYGFVHWNVIHLLAQSQDGIVYVVDELAERRWLVPRHAEALASMLARWNVESRIWRFVAGSDVFAHRGTTGGTIADQWAAQGWTLEGANEDRINGAAEYLQRLGDVEAGIAPRLFIFRCCRRLIECLPDLQHDPHRPEDVLKTDCDEDGEGGDDAYDSSRYGVMAVADVLPAIAVGPSRVEGWRG